MEPSTFSDPRSVLLCTVYRSVDGRLLVVEPCPVPRRYRGVLRSIALWTLQGPPVSGVAPTGVWRFGVEAPQLSLELFMIADVCTTCRNDPQGLESQRGSFPNLSPTQQSLDL